MARQEGMRRVTSFAVGLLYVICFSILAVVAMVKTNFNNRLRIGLMSITALSFFILQGGHLITLIPRLIGSEGVTAAAGEVGEQHVATYSAPLAAVGLAVTLGLTFVMGRAVCGYGCPVGAVQELAYDVPTGSKGKGKLVLPTRTSFAIRLVALGAIVGLYLGFGVDIIQVISPYQLWTLDLIFPGLLVVLGFFAASPFIYRPFCRLFCPYGAVASIIARFSRLKLEKTSSCVNCGICDKQCPTGEISERHGECYLCGRCVRACNLDAMKLE